MRAAGWAGEQQFQILAQGSDAGGVLVVRRSGCRRRLERLGAGAIVSAWTDPCHPCHRHRLRRPRGWAPFLGALSGRGVGMALLIGVAVAGLLHPIFMLPFP